MNMYIGENYIMTIFTRFIRGCHVARDAALDCLHRARPGRTSLEIEESRKRQCVDHVTATTTQSRDWYDLIWGQGTHIYFPLVTILFFVSFLYCFFSSLLVIIENMMILITKVIVTCKENNPRVSVCQVLL